MRAGKSPLCVVEEAKGRGIDEVIVGVSGGMDSVATLDVCLRSFRVVRPYFMYVVPGLEFQERYLRYLERFYGVAIDRVPHWMLARVYRDAVFRHSTDQTASLRKCRPAHFAAWIRQRTNLWWLATGEKAGDSLERNTSMVRDGAVQESRGRVYPLAWWSTSDVQSYLASKRLALPPDYNLNEQSDPALRSQRGSSFGGIVTMREIVMIAERFPGDLAKIRRVFPLVDVQLQRWKQLKDRGLAKPRGRLAKSKAIPANANQPNQPQLGNHGEEEVE
jgi:phosphoadenosine phosphosulfate reductase